MNTTQNVKRDQLIMKTLKLSELRHVLIQSSAGELSLAIRFGEDEYFLTLDSVPLEKYKNDEVMKLMFGDSVPKVKK